MTALISGSLAFDTIMVFQDRFKNHILPDKTHMLNVAFLVPEMRREFGGCAGNIAYNLKLLGESGYPLATVGSDFGTYAEWLRQADISLDYVKVIEDAYTAQAYITTDLDDNQITAFHPGAMSHAHLVDVPTDVNAKIGIVAPNGKQGMLQHAEQFAAAGIRFIFDPGQGLPMFTGEELLRCIDQATWVAANDYESQMLQQRTGLSLDSLVERVEAVVVTRGAAGSSIHLKDGTMEVPPAPTSTMVDPTGCGDAYRAGLLYGIMNGLEWDTVGRIASLMGAIKVEHPGTQTHSFALTAFHERYAEAFGEDFMCIIPN